ncbi:hypothetical protein A8L34_09460 [Bacillus sp. FJAT-27264]|uniref:TetR/AcrR family transcriptional regulator n=1 Tax=Paenibacillus sp. (strain DSM 101736 / FJAT-27264) TaxID=1850362 RepID=UPI000807C6D9|nr:TetR/AcrR family transcriptional regulator [Bacillus sp. FJAT-27264]OBZ14179.1 hypothetical protein A8L34_09460 [Bacillus sp. FJAT-27264]
MAETKRYVKGKQTKKKIFAVAKELILTHGYNQVTVDQICADSSISKGTFYIHYKSKEDIVRQLYRDDISEYMSDQFSKYEEEHPAATPMDKLKAFIVISLSFTAVAGEELTKMAYIVNLSSASSEGSSYLSDCLKEELLYGIVDEGRSQALFTCELTSEEIVNYVYTFITGSLIAWCQSNFAYDIVQTSEKSVDFIIKGLR